MTEEEIRNAANLELKSIGCQYTIMYMSRLFSQADFLAYKIMALTGKVFSKYEVIQVFEAFTIKTVCDWEWYIEKIICECLQKDTSALGGQLSLKLPKEITTDECVAYLNGLGYFDIRSASNLKSVSKKILVDNRNPFLNFDKETSKRIDDYYVLRNYIAHRSNKSKKALTVVYNKYKQETFVEAGDFLLSIDTEKSQLQIQLFESAFWLSSYKILEFLYPNTYKWIMGNEEVYNENCQARFLAIINQFPRPNE
ncbi:hypothetical protein ACFSJU_07525 [Paradesertivirga mongoliensis]|uniref:RiboL-PSP-HEPN domain-containing protein n=1 Tax=Paradesertivirga mongoliensis TaxID=2100740 RepID=A0ABW4ZJK8_9SPHI|nr:hypothetical protein [Pedobacter mongoliensis]